MAPLFRKIRQSLLNAGRVKAYGTYAIGEIILVVVGIMIALTINNWNERSKLKVKEGEYLMDLKEEFIYNKSEIERVMELNRRNIEKSIQLIEELGIDPPKISESDFGLLATGSLSSEVQFNPSLGVLSEVISSGKLGMISNEQLKFALSSWDGLMSETKLQEAELHRVRFNTIDIIRNEGNLRKAIHGPGLERMGISPSKFDEGNLHLLNYIPFEGHMMGFVTMSTSINAKEYSKINQEIDQILGLIQTDLESGQ